MQMAKLDACMIYIAICYISPWVMDPLVYHLDQPTDQLTELGAHTPTLARAKRLRVLGADRPRVS
jgi:hypothetical protein